MSDAVSTAPTPPRAPAPGPTGHSQQVPVPGFATAPNRGLGLAALFAEVPPIPIIRNACECSPLDEDTLRSAFACRTPEGHRFVLQ